MRSHPHSTTSALRGVLLALILGIAGNALAQTWDARIAGVGTKKCTDWQQWKEAKNSESRAMALEWTQGFISAHNVYARKGSEDPNSVVADVKVLLPLLDAYCQKNPGDRLISGVIEITQSLGGIRINLVPKTSPAPNPRPENKGKVEL